MKRMRPPVAWDLGLALLAASPSQLRSRSEPRVPACARDGRIRRRPEASVKSAWALRNMGGNFRFNRLGQATAGRRRAISPSADRRKMTLAGATQQLYRLSWRYPFLRKIGVFINARIRRLHSPSPRFSYSSSYIIERRGGHYGCCRTMVSHVCSASDCVQINYLLDLHYRAAASMVRFDDLTRRPGWAAGGDAPALPLEAIGVPRPIPCPAPRVQHHRRPEDPGV